MVGEDRWMGSETQRVLVGLEGWKPWREMEKVRRPVVALGSAERRMERPEEEEEARGRGGGGWGEDGRSAIHDQRLFMVEAGARWSNLCGSVFWMKEEKRGMGG